jgi:hypothetical protein
MILFGKIEAINVRILCLLSPIQISNINDAQAGLGTVAHAL